MSSLNRARHAITPSLVELNNASFTTTAEVDEVSADLMRALGLKTRNLAARLAIARSLAISSLPEDAGTHERGKVIKGMNLFGDELRTWLALILEHADSSDISLEQVQDLVSRHWRRGMLLVAGEWQAAGEDFDKFIVHLASQAGMRIEGTPANRGPAGLPGGATPDGDFVFRSGAVTVKIGDLSKDIATQQEVSWLLNGPGRAPHVAVVGAAGTGKTRSAMSMLRSITRQAGAPILLFDMAKGDLAGNAELVESLNAEVIDPLKTPIPLDVLFSPADQVKAAAMRFRESFKRAPSNRIGDAQGDIIREAAERALNGQVPVRVSDVFDRLKELYAEKRKKDDIVTATFKDMVAWELFRPKLNPTQFLSRSWVIDLHAAPEAVKRLVVFLLMDAVHTHLSHEPDSPLDDAGNRSLRLVVCVDEARLVLGYDHQSIISLVRESRSKGGVMVFISQSPDDFDQKNENFFENIGLGVCFRTNARSAALNQMLGQNFDLGSLKDGVCVTRLVERGLIQVRAW